MFHGRHLVIINKGKTKMEGAADLVFHDSIGKVLGKIGSTTHRLNPDGF
jgi:NAD-dependent deacetylase